MADSVAFEYVCDHLEQHTSLSRLEARGTVRLTLKQAGLDAASVTPDQMGVILDKVMPGELRARGLAGVEEICRALVAGIPRLKGAGRADSPEDVFRRLG